LAALAVGFASTCPAQPPLEEDPIPALRPPEAAAARTDDLITLEDRLKETNAIPALKKLGLKGEIDDLLAKFRLAHAGGRPGVEGLRQPYNNLIAKIHGMLIKDPKLAQDIVASKDAIWERLADRTKFASLE
jgi:hypothetical protein